MQGLFQSFPRGTSDALATSADLRQHDVDAFLVDRAKRRVGEPQADPAILAFDPETPLLEVGQEATLRPIVRVRNVVPHHRGLAGDLTDSSHRSLLRVR